MRALKQNGPAVGAASLGRFRRPGSWLPPLARLWAGSSLMLLIIALSGCAKQELPPLPPAADMCALYSSYRYSPAAAQVEELSALRAHASNEEIFANKCLLGDRSKSLGPR